MRGLEPIGFVRVVVVCGSFPHPRHAVSVLSFDGALARGSDMESTAAGDTEEFIAIF